MKRCILAILSLLYLCTSIGGTTIYMHYCMGELINCSLKNESRKTCINCGMEKSSQEGKGCCKDEQKRVKLDKHNNRTGQSPFQFLKLSDKQDYISNSGSPELPVSFIINNDPVDDPPPHYCAVPLFIRYGVFRI